MNTTTTQKPPAQQEKPLQYVMRRLEEVESEWPGLLTNPALKFRAEYEWLLQFCEKSTYATDMAAGNIDATMSALRNVAAIGVTLDPVRKLAYALPRDKKMVYDLSYRGLIDIAIRAKAIVWAQAAIVHENDTFELQGYDAAPLHKYNPFSKARGEIVGAYVVVKTPQGDFLTNTMPVDEINAIRDRSSAWKGRDPKKLGSGGPWETDWAEMAKKTVVKNAWKYWPSGEAPELLARAVHYLNTDGGQGIDLTPEDASNTLVKIWTEKVNKAKDAKDVAQVWIDARAAFAEDPEGMGKVREVVAVRNRELGVTPKPNGTPGPTTAPTPAPTTAPTPAPTAAPTPAPTKAPAASRAAAPKGPPADPRLTKLTDEGRLVATSVNHAKNYDELTATGDAIDERSEADQKILNELFNERMKLLDANGGVAP